MRQSREGHAATVETADVLVKLVVKTGVGKRSEVASTGYEAWLDDSRSVAWSAADQFAVPDDDNAVSNALLAGGFSIHGVTFCGTSGAAWALGEKGRADQQAGIFPSAVDQQLLGAAAPI